MVLINGLVHPYYDSDRSMVSGTQTSIPATDRCFITLLAPTCSSDENNDEGDRIHFLGGACGSTSITMPYACCAATGADTSPTPAIPAVSCG